MIPDIFDKIWAWVGPGKRWCWLFHSHRLRRHICQRGPSGLTASVRGNFIKGVARRLECYKCGRAWSEWEEL